MTHSEVLKMVDHTLLAQTATWEEIRQICDDGLRYGTASVCIPPCYVAAAAEYVQGKHLYSDRLPKRQPHHRS